MLRTDVKPPVAWLACDRPDKLNATTRGFFGELAAAVRAADPVLAPSAPPTRSRV